MENVVRFSLLVIAAIVAAIVMGLIGAIPVWFLWNAAIPQVFGLPIISFYQALCISLLCSFLFSQSSSGGSK